MAEPSKQQLLAAALLTFFAALLLALFLWSLSMDHSPTSQNPGGTDGADVTVKVCPIHKPEPIVLPLTEFGICRSRKDGLNLYCKSCIRKKVTDSRRALKEYRATRRLYAAPVVDTQAFQPSAFGQFTLEMSKRSPVERVREAIRKGARTQRDIAQETRLGKDDIGDALAHLLLWTREIKSLPVNGGRGYFINDSADLPVRQELSDLPTRRPDVMARQAMGKQNQTGSQRKWKVG